MMKNVENIEVFKMTSLSDGSFVPANVWFSKLYRRKETNPG